MKYLFIFALYFSHANAAPIAHLTKLGEGEMTYLFWTLYQAELYVTNTQLDLDQQKEVALKVTYQKNISNKNLVKATKEQWQHLEYQADKIDSWLIPLSNLLPDVQKQDTLTLQLNQQGVSEFYFNQKPIGQIQDPSFGPAFLAIWLSENTTEPSLRQKLLGQSP